MGWGAVEGAGGLPWGKQGATGKASPSPFVPLSVPRSVAGGAQAGV